MSAIAHEQVEALSLSDAAKACAISRSTIRRKLDASTFPNAFRLGDDGPWMVPLSDLVGAGLDPGSARTDQRASEGPALFGAKDLETELLEERIRRHAAEELAAERGRALEDLRLVLRIIGQSEEADQTYPDQERAGHATNGNGTGPALRDGNQPSPRV